MKIIFMRHGSTTANEQHLFCGSTNTPLSVAGEAQVRDAKKYIEKEKVDVWLCGDSLRTRQSAKILFEELLLPTDTIQYRTDIREVDFGKFENLSFSEISVLYPYDAKEYMANWQSFSFPGGESAEEYYKSCRKSINDIINTYNGLNICIIAHKGYICASMSIIGGLGMGHMFELDIECGKFIAVEI